MFLFRKKNTSKSDVERFFVATPRQLMWWRFRKHKIALVSLSIIAVMYLIAVFAEFASPYDPNVRHTRHLYTPPQQLHFYYDETWHLWPAVYQIKFTIDPETLRRIYYEIPEKAYPITLFAQGEEYDMWGLWKSNRHLFGVEKGGTVFLLGTDRMGRDMLSRIFAGARISLSVGFIGVFLSFTLGIVFGGISGYYGGVPDLIIQRIIEVLRSFPSIPLWMGLSAALPLTWSPLKVYFAITLILSLISWIGVARAVRGKLLALREEDFAMAAYLAGASRRRIIYKHLMPSFMSHIIVTITLRIPVVSWGILLKECQNVQDVAHHPWLLLPVLFLIVVILSFNFMGDGLRDAADPYSS